MNILKRIIPKSIKCKIKSLVNGNNDKLIKEIIEDIAERKACEIGNSCKRFNDKIVVVTGGYGFVGKTICKRFASEGAVVFACGRNKDKLNKFITEENNSRINPCVADITNENDIDAAFSNIVKEYGAIDILVNCAGGSARDEYSELKDQKCEVIRDIIEVNLTGTLLCSKFAAKYMSDRKSGKIINISSTIGVGGKSGFSEYAAAKSGIIGFTRSLALEMGKFHVNVNCVTPGIVERGELTAERLSYISSTNAMNSIGIGNDIAYAVTFLASEEARFITGQNIIVDGGRSLGLKGD